MNLVSYTSVSHKEQTRRFEYFQEHTFESLVQRLNNLTANGYCFRGQRNALWEIVSSAQRVWNNWRCKECVTHFVQYLTYLSMSLEYARSNVTFPVCDLRCCKTGLRDHERWGYLQHYCWPTPLIDFTKDFQVALYMAVRSIPRDAADGWFSIYAIYPEFANGEENIDLNEFVETTGGEERSYDFRNWQGKETFIIRKDEGHWCPAISKNRMASQGGLFVYLNSEEKSLEEVFAQKHKMDTGEADSATEEHNRIICIDVPYSVVKDVKAYLMDKQIDAHGLGLSDDSKDRELKAKYKCFEKEFLEHCGMSVSIRIGHGTFVRSFADEILFWNGRTGASRLLQNAAVLECIDNRFRRWKDITSEIVSKLQCSFDVAERDFWPIVEDLTSDGLIEIEGRQDEAASDEAAAAGGADAKGANEHGDCFDFFKKNQLPIELHIDLTSACTERCVHCYLPDYPHQFLEFKWVEKALSSFRAAQGMTVYLTGGECMMHPNFAEICRLCRGLDLNFVVMSNLTLCDEKMVAVLKETDPQFVNVSLYSMDAAEHDAITRRKGSWQETMDAILACEKAGVHVRLAAPLLKENRKAFAKLKVFADEHHMHLVTDCCIVPRCDHTADNVDHACSSEELEQVLSENKGVFDRGWHDGTLSACDAKVCEIGDTRICLNSHGDYYPCDGMHGYVLGNVQTHELKDVWHGEKLNQLRALKNRDFGNCASCEHRPFCKVCPAYNFNATGKLTETTPAQCELARVIHKVYGGR